MPKSKTRKYLTYINVDKENIIQLPIAIDKSFNVKIKTVLSANDMSSMVNSISEALFENDEYRPELYKLLLWKAIFAFYTDLDITEIDNDILVELIHRSELTCLILENIESSQLRDIKLAISKKVEYKKLVLLSEQKQALDKALKTIEYCTQQYEKLLGLFKNIDIKEAFDMLNKLSSVDEQKIVNSIMDYKNTKNEEEV